MNNAKWKMENGKWKILRFAICNLQFALLLSSCVSFELAGEIQKGRMELMYGDPKVALAHFQRAAELDPGYRLNYSIFPEGVWTYVGRAYYTAGRFPEARQALERARSREEDNLARLYLGLVLAQNGDREKGLREIEAGLAGLVDWFDWVEQYHTDGPYWDPGRPLRSAMQRQIAMIKGRDVNLPELIQNGAQLGRDIEIEIDRSRAHRILHEQRKSDGGDDRRP